MKALDRKLLRNLQHIKGQALAIALVIAAAVATLVMSSGTYQSLAQTRDAYYDRYYFADVFADLKRAPETVSAQIKAIPGVSRVQTGIRQYGLVDMPSVVEPVRSLISSLPPEGETGVNLLALREGRWLRPGRTDEILVHEAFAEAHGIHPGDSIGVTINGRKRIFRVAGIALSPEFVYVIGPGDLISDNLRFGVFWMNRDALEAAGNLEGAFNEVAVRLEKNADAQEAIGALDRILSRYGGTGTYTRKDHVSDAFVTSELKQLRTMTLIIPPIFLAAAAFLLNMAMGRLVETERGQIGLLKAIGYSNGVTGLHYLRTAVIIISLGIVAGWVGGWWMGRAMTRLYVEYYRFPILAYQITPGVFLGAALISMAAGCAGTYLAIRRAVALPPATAMLPPQPPSYRAGQLERMGIFRTVTPSGRMALRHILRWPLRSGFTSLGVGLAIALLVAMLNFYSSVDVMLDSFFFRNNRQDITINFTDIRPDSAVKDLIHLPGVMDVELQRSAPAQLFYRHLSERVVIQGLDPGASLARPLDVHGKEIALLPEGIVLNERLAKHLGVGAEGTVNVRILEGRMSEQSMPVTGITNEYIGLSAYMRRDALNRMMHEGPVANTAMVLIDESKQEAFYSRLKEMPYVAGVSARASAVGLFRRMVEENIFVILSFYILFASILAFGVVYNNTRLILAERAREFAMLRVLGYYKPEVSAILAGEIAMLVLLALPMGCLLGYALVAMITAFFSTDLFRLPFAVEPQSYGYAIVAILIAAAVSCSMALYRLADINLLDVLKERR